MEFFTPVLPEDVASLGIALVVSSSTPLVLLDQNLVVIAVSTSFCADFDLLVADVVRRSVFDLGNGEWNIAQLKSALQATVSGNVNINAYEFDLTRENYAVAHLVAHAHRLELVDKDRIYVVLAIADVTAQRRARKRADELSRDNQSLMDELQHRVANSLQIIASILMQNARRVQSDEVRLHLQDAHHRVMSIATLQKLLSKAGASDVKLNRYFDDLCASIRASMIADNKFLSLTVSVDETAVSSDESISLGLIVTELVINALKHAFPDRERSGGINVDYRRDTSGWRLSVSDDGIGMPDAAELPKAGLGTGIVEALAKKLGAAIDVRPLDTDLPQPGTVVTIAHNADHQAKEASIII